VVDGFKNLLASHPNVELVGSADNGQRAIEIAENISLDLILMDIDMPIMNGVEATRELKKQHDKLKIIIISMHGEKAMIKKMMEIGADGYLLKNSTQEELFSAIDKVANGGKFFSEEVTMSLLKDAGKSINDPAVALAELSEREIEILRWIAEGLSNKQIGEKLFISHRTVDTHRTNIMKKLEVNNIAGLIRIALKNNLVS
jgi:two-component system response regulator NreC